LDKSIDDVEEGTGHLVKAETYQKCSRITLCLLFVVVAFAGVGIVLVLKILFKMSIL
jgi:t-SNARE complex subunit (syntaxin)